MLCLQKLVELKTVCNEYGFNPISISFAQNEAKDKRVFLKWKLLLLPPLGNNPPK